MTTAKVDQGGNKSNNICSRPSPISKNSDKISQKINPQKSSKDFDVQNLEKIINNGATTHGHKFPATRGFLIQIYADLRKILQNWWNHSIHWPTIYKTWKLQAQKSLYVPPRAAIDLRWPTVKPLKTAQICPLFLKTDYTIIFYGLRSTKPRIFKTKEASTRHHAPLATSAFIASDSRASTRHLTLQRCDVTDDVILH